MYRVAYLILALILLGCSSREDRLILVKNVVPQAILPGASGFEFHAADPDSDIYLFEYIVPSKDQSTNISDIHRQFDNTWTTDTLTSSEIVLAKTERNKPFGDIDRQVRVHAGPDGAVLVLMAGIDSPAEEPFLAKTLKQYIKRVRQLNECASPLSKKKTSLDH